MKKLISALITSLCLVGFQSTSQATDVSFSAGLASSYGGYHATGTEEIAQEGGDYNEVRITEEAGVFTDSHQSIFGEMNIGDNMSVGVEFALGDISTPTNTNVTSDKVTGSGVNTAAQKENTVSASFSDKTTVYIQARMLGGLYSKIMYHTVNVISEETLNTGGSYGDATVEGLGLGLGYQHDFDDLGVFVRAEVTASGYEDVKAINSDDNVKTVKINNMYGAEGSIKIGKTF